MDNQLVQPQILAQRIILIVIVVLAIITIAVAGVHIYRHSDPYVQEVLSLKGDIEKGHAIFQINCAGCHGLEADGNVGPSLKHVSQRKSRIDLINQVVSGQTPPMPKFQASAQEMADLLSYLEQL